MDRTNNAHALVLTNTNGTKPALNNTAIMTSQPITHGSHCHDNTLAKFACAKL